MAQSRLTAVLGPTNTGKTHLAVTRMCGYASGMMGFPLRLLAREVYDRVVAIKGARQVALITGEERIVPEGARYWLCTVEAMPSHIPAEFLAIDEIQLAADPERGHVFTDRLLHRRGTAETMFLGAATIAPLIRRLVPEAFIEQRPRFSTLSFAGPRKLSRLPRRSAVIAFTADEVYGLAEMLRRQKGGAAVVMGALSPHTRNRQVELYQSGEVDYLVATDAIGMGLNMDIDHVAFASLSKFDGQRQRRLTPAEIGQIAGRAGRYQTDGSFGALALGEDDDPLFTEPEIAAITEHEFRRLKHLTWRNARLDWASLPRLLASLEQQPDHDDLVRVRRATDEAVLRELAKEEDIAARASSPARLQLLWDACNLPDYRKAGQRRHAALVGKLFTELTLGAGHVPRAWIGREISRLDDTQGGIDALAARMSAARTWTYISHRQGWLADQAEWAERTRALEEKLSDALHERLTQRFVDRRTSVLMRELAGDVSRLPLEIGEDGTVEMGGEALGTVEGFRFQVDPGARAGEKKKLINAAERRLAGEFAGRATELAHAPAHDLSLTLPDEGLPEVRWQNVLVGHLAAGASPLAPVLRFDGALRNLEPELQRKVDVRIGDWLSDRIEAELKPLARIAATAARGDVNAAPRGLAVQLIEAFGILDREAAAPLLATMVDADRKLLHRAGIRIGVSQLFVPSLLRPGPTRWRIALWAAFADVASIPALPGPGLVSVERQGGVPDGFYRVAGFGLFGGRAVRLDMVERLARDLAKRRKGAAPLVPPADWMHRLGVDAEDFSAVMKGIGYRRTTKGDNAAFSWRGHGGRPPHKSRRRSPSPAPRHSPFAVLADLHRGGE
ncbi:helicase [Pacificimonas flava]|uniref:Helicase n=2 Tax=Pacificimonas TaxID=1960290 RepID=A0A219B2V6_9SPHN|nr:MULTISPECIES: DEAD/DEAH box helicase [Pacificimonas]OWV32453.1 helicase [Pacificimonas flava]